MSESFDADWLELREPFDAAARDPGLAARLAAALPARPRLLDLGAGTGSLLRWLGHFIGRAQAWTLVDADASLIEEAFAITAERAEAVGWAATWPGRRTLLLHSPAGAWRLEGLVADLAAAPENLPLHAVDAVVNTALCDLVSAAWIERMAASCAARRLPFYAALNVSGRDRFAPPHRGDAIVARGFARDQARDKGFGGAALGPRAPATIARAFAAHGYTVHLAPSDWVIPRRAGRMAMQLAEGHAAAALRQERRAERAIAGWMLDRARQAREARLSVRVGHLDLLCLPPSKEGA
jgi:SAM-dependent methyltransferase